MLSTYVLYLDGKIRRQTGSISIDIKTEYFLVACLGYLTIILRGRVGYRMIDNQRGA